MKFNKSAESDFWYVGFDGGFAAGKIKESQHIQGAYLFEPKVGENLGSLEILEITNFMLNLEKEAGTITTSTFKSNSQ